MSSGVIERFAGYACSSCYGASHEVVLFGPTSSTEVELFGLGEKVVPDLDCLVCYKRVCDFIPNCMDSISVDMVKRAILSQLTVSMR